jgi:hypothetical protein
VYLRKWYHMVPSTTVAPASPDISPSVQALLTTAAMSITGVLGGKGLTLGSSSGRLAGSTVVVSPYYENHQMNRGRRRKISASSAKSEADYSKILQIINGSADT